MRWLAMLSQGQSALLNPTPGNKGKVMKCFMFSFLEPADTLSELCTAAWVIENSETSLYRQSFDLTCLFLFPIQGPQGRSGLPGLPGADGPPVRALITYIRTYSISVLYTHTQTEIWRKRIALKDICLIVHTHGHSCNCIVHDINV